MNRIGSSMRNKNSTSFIKSELFIIIINNFNNFDFHPNLAINYSTKWNFLLAKKMKFAVTSQNVWQIQLFINVFFIFFIFIGATSKRHYCTTHVSSVGNLVKTVRSNKFGKSGSRIFSACGFLQDIRIQLVPVF